MKNSKFWKCLREYFTIHLPKQRGRSEKTIEACTMAWNMFLRFIIDEKKINGENIDFSTFTSSLLTEFLDTMETRKQWKVSTRNQRLSCIRSFFKYASCIETITYSVYSELCSIPLKRGEDNSHVVDHMSKDAVAALIAAANNGNLKDFRNCFFMTLMYDAARNGEMLKLRLSDLNTENAAIYLIGKGSKPRLTPISPETIDMFEKYRSVFHKNSDNNTPMFYTIHKHMKVPMSDDNVARFLDKYADIARKTNPHIPENVHPHMFRHSRAMHLYQNGMPLEILSELLGHEDPETTLIYAYADTEMKRKAITKAAENSPLESINNSHPIWHDEDIISRLIRGY